MYIYKITTLSPLNLPKIICQLYLSKTGENNTLKYNLKTSAGMGMCLAYYKGQWSTENACESRKVLLYRGGCNLFDEMLSIHNLSTERQYSLSTLPFPMHEASILITEERWTCPITWVYNFIQNYDKRKKRKDRRKKHFFLCDPTTCSWHSHYDLCCSVC